ncbi:transcriptional regulator NrdR [Mahella australiensis]|uniref:Transcriptional repressor NrdR n=1 Tax=Mahella australiensis (strain DSM 15567 / CIP 107919 / 50-1 BON) TaxID=697281 RepID=F4A140_MAHA5|nr:transcriptional regulator NrdR [Mahella australiensis]AEE95943.1 ATP-cone domain protein [Mahella australiensis 50-1 BON]
MRCPYCNCIESRVIDSRPAEEYTIIRRRRECVECGKRFTTYEKVERIPLMVIKKDGRREPFDIDKIKNGIIKACEKRPVSMDDIEDVVSDIEKQVYTDVKSEITSHEIGEMVMKHLKDLDEVAYVRFASVYRQFRDVNTFMDELKKLLNERDETEE